VFTVWNEATGPVPYISLSLVCRLYVTCVFDRVVSNVWGLRRVQVRHFQSTLLGRQDIRQPQRVLSQVDSHRRGGIANCTTTLQHPTNHVARRLNQRERLRCVMVTARNLYTVYSGSSSTGGTSYEADRADAPRFRHNWARLDLCPPPPTFR